MAESNQFYQARVQPTEPRLEVSGAWRKALDMKEVKDLEKLHQMNQQSFLHLRNQCADFLDGLHVSRVFRVWVLATLTARQPPIRNGTIKETRKDNQQRDRVNIATLEKI